MTFPNQEPVEPAYRERMKLIGQLLDEFWNGEGATQETRKVGFVLFVFPFGQGEDHRSNYLSNANREDILATLKEFIARAEGRYVDPAKDPTKK